MNSKEIVQRGVSFGRPARIPRDLWILPQARLKYGQALDELLGQYPTDFAPNGYKSPGQEERLFQPGRFTDAWGSVWENTVPGIMGQVISFPLNDWHHLKTFQPPFHFLGKGFEKVDETIKANKDKFILGNGDSLFHRMCWVRNPQFLFIDILEERPEVLTLRDMIVEYLLGHLKHLLNYDHDGIVFSDDWGTQKQLFISPALWRKLFRPCYKALFMPVKESGRLLFFHSDGYILDIIEDLIELGVDALNCQVACMGVKQLGKRFKGRLCFWGELDRQWLLPQGTPEQIHQAVIDSLENLATADGGYIFQAEISGDVPMTNIKAMFNSWHQCSHYFAGPPTI